MSKVGFKQCTMVDGVTIARGIEVTVDGSRQGSASSRNVKFTPADIFEGHTKSLSFLGCMDREKMQFLWNLSNLRMREAVRCLAATAASITSQKAPVCTAVMLRLYRTLAEHTQLRETNTNKQKAFFWVILSLQIYSLETYSPWSSKWNDLIVPKYSSA